ncbi:hypothetical protein SUH3_08315 [Pseudosulfitobacter pseudonitzschiae]|uniref:Uncharacterized protein n=1 Tax=Pseudosulfitobacter pseudonitzschiae TaxID=1402135 RepID=A0A073IX16_9RHOB|nr:hypothetical protein SUH3_08315 [Pseudosulfitobacter pseudonitzschiae]
MRCAAVVVAEQHGKSGFALDQRSDVHLALSAFEDHQITLPFAKSLSGINVIRTFMDGSIRREYKATGPARVVWSPFFPAVRQITGKFSGLAIRTVNIRVDRLVADAHCLIFKLQTTRDLFWRPTFFELLDHSFAQTNQPHQFASPRASLGCCALSDNTVVSVQFWQLFIVVVIAFDLAIHRGNMPADLCSNLTYRHLRIQHIFYRATFTQVKLCMRHLPFSLLSSKIGEISQPSLECAHVVVSDLISKIMLI